MSSPCFPFDPDSLTIDTRIAHAATWVPYRKSHDTLFKPRPGTASETDRLVARRAFVQEILPPIVYQRLAAPLSRLGL